MAIKGLEQAVENLSRISRTAVPGAAAMAIMHPLDFSLLNRREADEEPEDDVLMQKAAGLAGGVRFGPDGNEVIPASPDVADMTEDDVMLMTVSEGIAGGVRYG
ncbi:TPA: phage tail protein [Escherichia coli]|nr:phage tail protein [Escherichia coli]